MNDKLNEPVYIISIKPPIYNFNKLFTNVNISKAVNTKKLDLDKALDNKTISNRVYLDIKNGRKDHFAFSGKGAIGLFLSQREILNKLYKENVKTNVLVCEEDCNIFNTKKFKQKIISLRDKDFDCAIFGGEYTKKGEKFDNNFFILNNGNYEKTHCVLWSPQGIQKVNYYINNIIEMQLDYFLSHLSKLNKLKILIENNPSTTQYLHFSDLSNDNNCKICNMDPLSNKYYKTKYEIIRDYTIYIIIGFIIFLIVIIVNML
tara:strand:- start:2606 stop:3388 length:783 start_codon:yes stop_codon:yes gene_type:complete